MAASIKRRTANILLDKLEHNECSVGQSLRMAELILALTGKKIKEEAKDQTLAEDVLGGLDSK